jgi:hypothetical protein
MNKTFIGFLPVGLAWQGEQRKARIQAILKAKMYAMGADLLFIISGSNT